MKRALAALLLAISNAGLAQVLTTEQYAEDGARTTPVSVSGAGPAAPSEQTVCAAGAWMRLRFATLVLEGADSLELAYYLNFATSASNGESYLLQYAGSNVYSGGAYYRGSSNDGKDVRFQLWGTAP